MYKVKSEAILQKFVELNDEVLLAKESAAQEAQEIGIDRNYSADKIKRLSAFLFNENKCDNTIQELNYLSQFIEKNNEEEETENGETEN